MLLMICLHFSLVATGSSFSKGAIFFILIFKDSMMGSLKVYKPICMERNYEQTINH